VREADALVREVGARVRAVDPRLIFIVARTGVGRVIAQMVGIIARRVPRFLPL
jgi:hypothetical protein